MRRKMEASKVGCMVSKVGLGTLDLEVAMEEEKDGATDKVGVKEEINGADEERMEGSANEDVRVPGGWTPAKAKIPQC